MEKFFDKEYTVKTDSPPEVPTLEITAKIGCRVNCKYCPQNLLIKRYSKISEEKELSLENFKKILNKLPQDVIICFAGFSEPFLSDFAVDMINYANDSGHEVSLFTTLVGLTLEKFEKIRHVHFRKVVIHLPDENNFANIPLTKEYLELFKIVIKAKKFDGGNFVDKMTCQTRPNKNIVELVQEKFHISWNMTNRAGNLKYSELANVSTKSGELKCRLSNYNHNVLLPNGDVVLCSMDFGLKYRLGNLLSDDYASLMDSPAMKQIKFAAESSTIDSLCRHCTESAPV